MLTAVGNATTGSSIPDADRRARQSEKLQARNTIERPCPKPTGGGSSAIAVVAQNQMNAVLVLLSFAFAGDC